MNGERPRSAPSPTAIVAATEASVAPSLAISPLYEVALAPEAAVHFPVPPGGRHRGIPNPGAGLVVVHIPAAGRYRVTSSIAVWIDVVAHGRIVPTADFNDHPRDERIHKSVTFDVAAPGDVLLQLNNVSIKDARQFNALVEKLDPKLASVVLVLRDGNTRFISLRPTAK